MSFSTTQRVLDALYVAHTAHDGQKRKTRDIPYIMHPTFVALLLAEAGASEELVIAGLLHDTLEDTLLSESVIKERFGSKVLGLVLAVTEEDKTLPWMERKKQALAHIPRMSHEELMLKSADAIANMCDTCHALMANGESTWDHFNSSKEDQVHRYQNLVTAIVGAWSDNPLAAALLSAFEDLRRLAEVE